ncbi:MAG TPA: LEA type 2 family protein [Hymenobacter sp.]|uniref:LEA type 2 family protein n=1 Tax=Hymenobacter sp. TaxID=1898978 RepID=UPI002D8060EE|nr:LEA type 2 family protein [Hymenobacter sp.]HET9504558.1 LEA type 2 family protein [Hymenobacter sp.]
MKKATRFLSCTAPLLVGLLATTASCTLRETGREPVVQRTPRFRVEAVEEVSLNGLDVLPLRTPADMDLPRRNQVIAGYVNQQLPLRVRVQVRAYNPNATKATLAGFDYTVLVDGRPLGRSRLVTALQLPAGDSVRVPVAFEFNTYKYLGDDAMPALRNFALGFGDPYRQRITLQVRPLLRAPKGALSSPASRTALAYPQGAAQAEALPVSALHLAN